MSPYEESQSDLNKSPRSVEGKSKIDENNYILFHSFFNIIEKRPESDYLLNIGGIVARCKVCLKKVKGSLRVSSNFILDLRLYHLEKYEV
ncbi:hypothetical protein FF38_13485 [Lucilia cuprina]|uniref:Uncharacterized protein n=1 Tax=Lucilia cuprina TaxID=7375 RepID=A0A0L0BTQ0_LUCCU|nr:hypothetical protein FF38_13485 [Lucilia cuprina]